MAKDSKIARFMEKLKMDMLLRIITQNVMAFIIVRNLQKIPKIQAQLGKLLCSF